MNGPIPLAPLQTNTDETGQRAGSVSMWNSYVDENNNWRPIPGLKSYADLGTNEPVQTYWWGEKNYMIAVSANRLWYQTTDGGDFTEVTISTGTLDTSKRICFVGTYWRLYLSSEGTPLVWTPGSDIVECSTGTVPTNVTHLAIIDDTVIAADPGSRAYYWGATSATSEITWAEGDTIQGLPDVINGLSVEWRDILLTGKRSVEQWYNAGLATPSAPFARREGAFVQRGVLAPYTLHGADNTWFFLDHQRKITRLAGRTPQIISTAIDRTLQSLDALTDAFAFSIDYRGSNWYVLVCPSVNRVFAYEYRLQQWAEWGVWQPTTSSWTRWPGNSYSYAESWNKHLVGSRKANGLVYEFDADTYQFDSDDIRMVVETAAIDRGTAITKRSDRILLRALSGETYSSNTAASMTIRHQDNGSKDWSNERILNFGQTGNYENIYQLVTLGMYRTRKWEFVIHSPTNRAIANIEEFYEVMMA